MGFIPLNWDFPRLLVRQVLRGIHLLHGQITNVERFAFYLALVSYKLPICEQIIPDPYGDMTNRATQSGM